MLFPAVPPLKAARFTVLPLALAATPVPELALIADARLVVPVDSVVETAKLVPDVEPLEPPLNAVRLALSLGVFVLPVRVYDPLTPAHRAVKLTAAVAVVADTFALAAVKLE
jgi:hypothetical protein